MDSDSQDTEQNAHSFQVTEFGRLLPFILNPGARSSSPEKVSASEKRYSAKYRRSKFRSRSPRFPLVRLSRKRSHNSRGKEGQGSPAVNPKTQKSRQKCAVPVTHFIPGYSSKEFSLPLAFTSTPFNPNNNRNSLSSPTGPIRPEILSGIYTNPLRRPSLIFDPQPDSAAVMSGRDTSQQPFIPPFALLSGKRTASEILNTSISNIKGKDGEQAPAAPLRTNVPFFTTLDPPFTNFRRAHPAAGNPRMTPTFLPSSRNPGALGSDSDAPIVFGVPRAVIQPSRMSSQTMSAYNPLRRQTGVLSPDFRNPLMSESQTTTVTSGSQTTPGLFDAWKKNDTGSKRGSIMKRKRNQRRLSHVSWSDDLRSKFKPDGSMTDGCSKAKRGSPGGTRRNGPNKAGPSNRSDSNSVLGLNEDFQRSEKKRKSSNSSHKNRHLSSRKRTVKKESEVDCSKSNSSMTDSGSSVQTDSSPSRQGSSCQAVQPAPMFSPILPYVLNALVILLLIFYGQDLARSVLVPRTVTHSGPAHASYPGIRYGFRHRFYEGR